MAEYAYREIITKAICGKGKKFSRSAHTVTPTHKPTNVLGCWVINHKYKTTYHKDAVNVDGTYDINTWYSYNNNTKTEVVCETVSYHDRVPLTLRDKQVVSDHVQVTCRMLQEPNCLEAKISSNGNRVVAQVEREFLVEVIGETKVKVQVDGNGLVEVEDDADEDKDLDKELNDLDSDFLTEDEDEE
ncbi:outer spore coat protein CotE [Sporolactobacillus sp. CPB3-1]|uniref:Outer spore coat protein CotE n=1 Tax=Sporolactobacillus mangiferae TaxID=2940498 RepID=A0ABT0M7H5_9BACL|nr:outer spore coat protein CotE [Sporolactobacillus mangiferae]MCL1630815.1 outer spore coat protein CotE [Sporolactobacillus mangiferae]